MVYFQTQTNKYKINSTKLFGRGRLRLVVFIMSVFRFQLPHIFVGVFYIVVTYFIQNFFKVYLKQKQ